jgi:hypothetical protein
MHDDADNTQFIEYLRRYLSRPGFHIKGTDLRVFSAMGDRVAGGLIELIGTRDQFSDVELQMILAAVKASLEYPEDIQFERDRRPEASVRLLERLLGGTVVENRATIVRRALERARRGVGREGRPVLGWGAT